MKTGGNRRIIAAAALSIASLSTPALAQDQRVLQSVLSDPGVQQHALEVVKQSAVMVRNPCPTARFALTGKGTVYIALERDASGAIVKGAWKQEVLENGCGVTRTLNVLGVVQGPKKLGVAALLPGTTRAGPQLQKDAVKFAVASAGGPEKNCNVGYVENTELVKLDGAPVAGASSPPWQEVWTLVSCTRRAHVSMRFTPESGGTQIVAGPTKVEPIQAKK